MKNLELYELNLKTIEFFRKCFDINGSPKNTENIKWQFLENPEKKSIVNIDYDLGMSRTANIYATFCVNFKVENSLANAAQSLDTMTDINYRGQGLFVKAANSVYTEANESSMAFVYGFPNGNSVGIFNNKLGWKIMDPVPFLIKPLKSKYFTDKITLLRFLPNFRLSFRKFHKQSNYEIEEMKGFPEEIDNIWNAFSVNIKVAVNRNKKYLDWRYIQKPNELYKIVHCYDVNREYLGCCVYSVKDKHNGKIGYIMELIFDLNRPKSGELLMSFAVDAIRKADADCILAWCFNHSPSYTYFRQELFFKMPERLKPIELHFGVRVFNEVFNEVVGNRDNWYISYSDSDTV